MAEPLSAWAQLSVSNLGHAWYRSGGVPRSWLPSPAGSRGRLKRRCADEARNPWEGYAQSNVNRDAKYTLKIDRDTGPWAVHLAHNEPTGWQDLLWLHEHPRLVELVNAVKVSPNGREGGQLYINDFGHILVTRSSGRLCARVTPPPSRTAAPRGR